MLFYCGFDHINADLVSIIFSSRTNEQKIPQHLLKKKKKNYIMYKNDTI